jgi:hypothetical protein
MFNNQCFAVAWDPGGKPGWGWSVNVDKARAQRDALTECSAKAGTTANGCRVVVSECDQTGSAVNGAAISDSASKAAKP